MKKEDAIVVVFGRVRIFVFEAERLVHGGGRRLRRTHAAVGKSQPHITLRSW